MREWFAAAELAGLPEIPSTDRRVRARADREGWQSRKKTKGKGREYHISSLPQAARQALAAGSTRVESEAARAGRAAAAKAKIAAEHEQRATLRSASDGLARLATLTGDDRSRAEARLAILDALNAFRNRSDQSKTAALQSFVTYFNDGAIDCAGWIREQVGTISAASLYRWQKSATTEGAARLAGNYGNRRGSGKIDSQPEIAEYAQAMLAAHPHLRATHLHQAIRTQFGSADRVTLPSKTACERWLKRWKTQNKSLYTALSNPDAWKSNYMPAFGSASEDVTRINQRWELDSTPADVLLSDGRHSLIGVIDVYSRRAKLLVSKTSTSAAVAAVVRRAILDWGVPESVKHDNGSDYTSHHLARVWQLLGAETLICNPYSGWEKPHIERFFRSFSHDLVEMLPGYAGHNVGERQAIESQKAFAERLMTRSETIEIRMDAAELQSFADRWVESIYEQREHSSLDGASPMQRAAGQPYQAIEDERALDVLLARAPGDGQRTIGKKGISIEGRWYIAPEMGDHVGEPVQVLYDETDMGRIHVFADLGHGWTHLCVAECPELTGISRADVAKRTRDMRTREVQRQRAEIRRAARKYKTADVAEQMLAERETDHANVQSLPGRSSAAESAGLDAAGKAIEALEGRDTGPFEPEAVSAETKQALQDVFRDEQAPAEPQTGRGRFAKWERIAASDAPTEEEQSWARQYQTSAEFVARYDLKYGEANNE